MTEEAFSPTAERLAAELRPHTPFAEAIVRRQSERAGVSPGSMTEQDLQKVVPLVIAAASGFVDPSVVARIRWVFLRK